MSSTAANLLTLQKSHRVQEKVQAHALDFSADGSQLAIQYASFSNHKFANKVLVWDVHRWRKQKL